MLRMQTTRQTRYTISGIVLAGGLALLQFAIAESAETYPAKPIRIIVPPPPGGSVETLASRIRSSPNPRDVDEPHSRLGIRQWCADPIAVA